MKAPLTKPPAPNRVRFLAERLHLAGHLPSDLLMLPDAQRDVIARQIHGSDIGLPVALPTATEWQAAIARLRVLIADERLRGTA